MTFLLLNFQENPYVKLLSKEVLNWFEHSKLIAFFHKNPTDADEEFQVCNLYTQNNSPNHGFFMKLFQYLSFVELCICFSMQARILLKRSLQMKMKNHGKEIMTEALTGTKFEPVLTLYQASTVVAFGPDPDVRKLLRNLKKMPKHVLLG